MLLLHALLLATSAAHVDFEDPWELATWEVRSFPCCPKPPPPIPFQPFEMSDARCLRRIEDPNHTVRIRAAGTLILRGQNAVRGLEALLNEVMRKRERSTCARCNSAHGLAFDTWDWARSFAGDALGILMAERLTSAASDFELDALLYEIRGYTSDLVPAVSALADIATRRGALGDDALGHLARLSGFKVLSEHEATREDSFHSPRRSYREPCQEAERALAGVLVDRLSVAADNWTAHELRVAHCAGMANEYARAACLPRLEAAFESGERRDLPLLRILGHFESASPIVREAYIEAWAAAPTDASEGELQQLPCRRMHDEETRAAFAEVFDRTANRLTLLNRLIFSGETDTRTSALALAVVEDFNWHRLALARRGFRGVLPIEAEDSDLTQINKLGITIATLQEEGLDYSEEEFLLAQQIAKPFVAPWDDPTHVQTHRTAIRHARLLNLKSAEIVAATVQYLSSDDVFGSAHTEAMWLLRDADLTASQEELLGGRSYEDEYYYEFTREGRRLPVASSRTTSKQLEYWSSLSCRQPWWIGWWLAHRPLTEHGERCLRAVLALGNCFERHWALELVEHHELDTPGIRRWVLFRRDDADSRVRGLARSIVSERGW